MRDTAAHPGDTQLELVLSWLTLAAGGIALVLAIQQRGPWADELWTMFLSDAELPLPVLLRERVLLDVHPPLFSLIARAAGEVLGDDLAGRRLVNLLALAAPIAVLLWAQRNRHEATGFLLVGLVLLVSFPWFLRSGSEHRSYFLQICLVWSVLTLVAILLETPDEPSLPNGGFRPLLATTLLLAVNLHFITTGFVALFLLGSALALRRTSPRRARFLAIWLGIGLAVFVGVALLQIRSLARISEGHWISTGTFEGIRLMVLGMIDGASLNPVGLVQAWRTEGVAALARTRPILAVAASTCLVGCAGLLVVNLMRPVVIDRFLIALGLVVLVTLAAFAARPLARPWPRAAFLLVALLALGLETSRSARHEGWNATARPIAERLTSCPGSLVVALDLVPQVTVPNGERIMPFGYAWVGRRNGFTPLLCSDVAGGPLPAPRAGCPLLLWVEHEPLRDLTLETLLARYRVDPRVLEDRRVELLRGLSGYVVVLASPGGAP